MGGPAPRRVRRRFLDLIRHFIVFDDDARRDWSLGGQQAIKHRMHLDYLRTGRGRPHIDW
jgi:hypothetical protein